MVRHDTLHAIKSLTGILLNKIEQENSRQNQYKI